MKIALVGRYSESEIKSGPEKVAEHLFREILLYNDDVSFITYFFKTDSKRKINKLLFGREIVSPHQQIYRLGIIQLIFKLLNERYDVVHILTFERFELVAIFLKLILKFKLVYTIHGIYKFERTIFNYKQNILSSLKDLILEKLLYNKAELLVFLSHNMINIAKKYYNFNLSKASIIPNGVYLSEHSNEKRFDFSKGIEIVFYNGLTNTRERGLDKLLKILFDSEIKFNISVLGDTKKNNIQNVKIIKPLPQKLLLEFFNEKHVFIDNLGYMPFSITALEAMSRGMVLIVSDKSGLSSYIKNGENGFVYCGDKPEEISKILSDIYSGRYHLEELSRNALLSIQELNWSKIARQYHEAYTSLMID